MKNTRNDPFNLISVSHIVVGTNKLPVIARGVNSVTVELPDDMAVPYGATIGAFRTRNGHRIASIPASGKVLIRDNVRPLKRP